MLFFETNPIFARETSFSDPNQPDSFSLQGFNLWRKLQPILLLQNPTLL